VAFAGVDLEGVLEPEHYVGRAPQQVLEFIREEIDPLRERYHNQLEQEAEVNV
jgi:adenylosuccinate lyase